ncbi:MAG: DUF3500 domain-containing protein [Gammaproteobacteria bacterium]
MRTKIVLASILALVVSIGWAAVGKDIATDMAESAFHFLRSLDSESQDQANLAFDDENRYDWHFIPRAREGLPYKSMTAPQSGLAHRLMNTALSHEGMSKALGVMYLDQILFEIEGRSMRDSELYYVTIFGDPSGDGNWGWRVEGHHLSLNLTIKDGEVISTSPTFMGANPARVLDGPQEGLQVLADEQDLARQLLHLLDDSQRKIAVYADDAPRDIESRELRQADPGPPRGLAAGEMTTAQADLLMRLVDEYAHRIRPELAELEMEKVRDADVEEIHFGWAGGSEPGEPHYYRIHGPTFLIEYDNRQNGANHIHSVWRDLTGDFGDDLLAQHYAISPHHNRQDAFAFVGAP